MPDVVQACLASSACMAMFHGSAQHSVPSCCSLPFRPCCPSGMHAGPDAAQLLEGAARKRRSFTGDYLPSLPSRRHLHNAAQRPLLPLLNPHRIQRRWLSCHFPPSIALLVSASAEMPARFKMAVLLYAQSSLYFSTTAGATQ
jgi:hypothetical protein